MSDEKQEGPPALPGERWRGLDEKGAPVAITIEGGDARAWWIETPGTWGQTNGCDIFRDWALAERARADKAEAALAHIEAMKRNWGQP